MKFSEMTTEHASDTLCQLTPYVEPIVTDTELVEFLHDRIDVGEETTKFELYCMGLKKINGLIPILLKRQKENVFNILAIINDKTVEDVKKQNLLITLHEIKSVLKDKDLVDFFRSCALRDESE